MSRSVCVLDEGEDVLSTIEAVAGAGWQEEAFFVANVAEIVRKFDEFVEAMPRVKPYYAVKCNDHWSVLETFAALGLGFDCASKKELQTISSLGVPPSRIIYAHPTKPISHLKFAAANHFNLTTFDNQSELHKIKKFHPNSKLVIRLKCDAKEVLYDLGMKFGCDPVEEAPELLRVCKDLELEVVGVCFHVGSGCKDVEAFRRAIKASRRIFDFAAALGYSCNLLDIGGGFPGEKGSSIEKFAGIINEAVEEYFGDPLVEVIAEPGQYFVSSAFTLACNVLSVRAANVEGRLERTMMYYVNDGIFNSFCFTIYEPDTAKCAPLKKRENAKSYNSIIWGQTCDSTDIVIRNQMLPEMRVGDWVYFENMGAYTLTVNTPFNGFPAAKVLTTIDSKTWLRLRNVFSPEKLWITASPREILQ